QTYTLCLHVALPISSLYVQIDTIQGNGVLAKALVQALHLDRRCLSTRSILSGRFMGSVLGLAAGLVTKGTAPSPAVETVLNPARSEEHTSELQSREK